MGGGDLLSQRDRYRIFLERVGSVTDTLPDGPIVILKVFGEVAQIGACLLEHFDEAVQVGHRSFVLRNVRFGERAAGVVLAPRLAFLGQGRAQFSHGGRHVRPDQVELRRVLPQPIRIDRKCFAHTVSLCTCRHCPGTAGRIPACGETPAAGPGPRDGCPRKRRLVDRLGVG
ncbi:hypothetical protein ACWESM_34685 [Nocardia sp. NPDC003999]